MLSKSKYEEVTKEALNLLNAISAGNINTPRLIKFFKEFTGEVKPRKRKDRRATLEQRIKL